MNISRFARSGDAHMPVVGEQVRLTLHKAGHVRKVGQTTAAPQTETAQPTMSGTQVGKRDRLIVRQSLLRAAVGIPAAGGKEVNAAEVLDQAETLEQRVYRAA